MTMKAEQNVKAGKMNLPNRKNINRGTPKHKKKATSAFKGCFLFLSDCTAAVYKQCTVNEKYVAAIEINIFTNKLR